MPQPKIGVKVKLVPYLPEHAEYMLRWFYDFRYRAFFREYEDYPFTVEDFKSYGEALKHKGSELFTLIDKETNTPIGLMTYSCLKKKSGVYRFGILLDAAHQHNTYAIEGIILLAFYLFEHKGCQKYTIEFLASDKHIQRIAEKGGFDFECLLKNEAFLDGEYHDEVRYYFPRAKAYEIYGEYHAALDEADSEVV